MREIKNEKVTVFGSFVVDLMARVPHIPVPGETLASSFFKIGAGGKGFNQCIAAWKAGAQASMVCKMGNDAFGRIALDTMESLGMPTDSVILKNEAETGNALIIVDDNTGQNLIAVTLGANGTITENDIMDKAELLTKCGILLVQLEVNLDALERAIDIAKNAGAMVVFNCAPARPYNPAIYEKIDIIMPNESEAQAITGIEILSEKGVMKTSEWFFDRGVEVVIITMGENGVFVSDKNESRMIKPFIVDAIDTTGAGDAFCGNFVASLALGKDLWESAFYANAAAALSVTRLGTSPAMPARKEVEEFLRSYGI